MCSKYTMTADDNTVEHLLFSWKIIAIKGGRSSLVVAPFPSRSFQTTDVPRLFSLLKDRSNRGGFLFSTVSQRLPDVAVAGCKMECISDESISHCECLSPLLSVEHK